MTNNPDVDKYFYSGYSIGIDIRVFISISRDEKCKNVIIFGVVKSSSAYFDNKKDDILILGKGPTDGLDDTTIAAEAEYTISFSEKQKKFY